MQITEETTRQIELLERIANSLESIDAKLGKLDTIETILEEKQNKTQDGKDCRELMKQICKYYMNTEPKIDIVDGTRLQVYRLRNAIAVIKNFRNTKLETRKLTKWLRKLEEREFICRTSDQIYEVLDNGSDWWSRE